MTYEDLAPLWDEFADELDVVRALQSLINGGHWSLEGSTGRAMMSAIEAGVAALGTEPASDYWGNRIPSRHEVEPGTKGSVEYVLANSPYGAVIE